MVEYRLPVSCVRSCRRGPSYCEVGPSSFGDTLESIVEMDVMRSIGPPGLRQMCWSSNDDIGYKFFRFCDSGRHWFLKVSDGVRTFMVLDLVRY